MATALALSSNERKALDLQLGLLRFQRQTYAQGATLLRTALLQDGVGQLHRYLLRSEPVVLGNEDDQKVTLENFDRWSAEFLLAAEKVLVGVLAGEFPSLSKSPTSPSSPAGEAGEPSPGRGEGGLSSEELALRSDRQILQFFQTEVPKELEEGPLAPSSEEARVRARPFSKRLLGIRPSTAARPPCKCCERM